jgi:chromosome segregation ATPase
MRLLGMVLGLSLALAPMVATDDKSDPVIAARFADAIGQAFAGIINSGGVVWGKLGQGQAKDTLQTLATEAATLGVSKDKLRTQLVQNRVTDEALRNQVEGMNSTLEHMQHTLEKFANEVDAAAHPIGEKLRAKVEMADTDKILELDRVVIEFEQNHPQAAIKALDSAITDLQTMQATITCFQDSITKKKAACDPKTLRPIT